MKSKFWALTPLLVFLLVYFSVSVAYSNFYKLPVLLAFLLAAMVGFLIYPRFSFQQKTTAFSAGAGDSTITLMILIFVLAGAFAGVTKGIGAVDATVELALSFLPPRFIIAGLFVTSCFISFSLGTSVGTVVALAPIAVGLGGSSQDTLSLAIGAVVGGSMFGDNLSMISDTTIAATRTQGIGMREKFKVNFWIALPAAVLSVAIYLFFPTDLAAPVTTEPVRAILVTPYLFVLVAALAGINVIWVLTLGIVTASVFGLIADGVGIWSLVNHAHEGVDSMIELSVTCLLIGGIVGLIQTYGGIDFVLAKFSQNAKSSRGCQWGIAALTASVNGVLANNTITILIVGPLAKTIAEKHKLAPKRVASILDTVSCVVQGIIPYGAQILAALAASSYAITPYDLLSRLYYPLFLGLSLAAFITLSKGQTESAILHGNDPS